MALTVGIAALNSLKSLYDLVEEVRNSNDPERLRAAASQMVDLALTARGQTAALQDERNAAVIELAALKAMIEQSDRFDEKAKDYTRERAETGATVYREKNSAGPQGQSPYFCPKCFSDKCVSIMNPAAGVNTYPHKIAYTCGRCATTTELPKLR